MVSLAVSAPRRHGMRGRGDPPYIPGKAATVLPTVRLGSNGAILLAPSGANCFTIRSRVVLLSPHTAKANQRK